MIKNFLIVGLGGAVGSMLRYAVQKFFQLQTGATFPTGTLLVNIAGCFLIGILWSLVSRSLTWNDEMKLLLMTGFCGGFTTFSAFSWQTVEQLQKGNTTAALANVALSVVGCVIATWFGWRFAR